MRRIEEKRLRKGGEEKEDEEEGKEDGKEDGMGGGKKGGGGRRRYGKGEKGRKEEEEEAASLNWKIHDTHDTHLCAGYQLEVVLVLACKNLEIFYPQRSVCLS